MTCIVGVDTASNRYHWTATVPFDDGYGEPTPFGWYHTGKDAEGGRIDLFRAAKDMFRGIPDGSHVFCEEPLALAKNGHTTRLLCMAAGAIHAAFIEVDPDVYWHWVDVSSWKKRIVGKGNANKAQIAEWCQTSAFSPEWLLVYGPKEKDLFDAYCLMLYGQEMLNVGG